MFSLLRPAFTLTLLFTLVTGIAYPLLMTVMAQTLFPHGANGSLVRRDATVIGSELIGQNFSDKRYFWPRPSVTADSPYNAGASGGSNLGATSAALADRVQAQVKRLRGAGAETVPADAAMASGSGLDPDISPEYARFQAARVAAARQLPETEVLALIESHTRHRLFGFIGEPRVNVLEINLALGR